MAAVWTNAVLDNLVAEDILAKRFIILREFRRRGRLICGESRFQLILDLLDQRIAFKFGMLVGVERILQPIAHFGIHRIIIGLIKFDRLHFALRLACFSDQLGNACADFLDFLMAKFNGIDDRIFAHLFGAGFDHHNAVRRADNRDAHIARAKFRVRRIDDELSIHATDANRANRAAKRNVRERQGAGCGVDPDNVGIVFLVRGKDQRDHLCLVAEAFWE